jgi:hypothetical protein
MSTFRERMATLLKSTFRSIFGRWETQPHKQPGTDESAVQSSSDRSTEQSTTLPSGDYRSILKQSEHEYA